MLPRAEPVSGVSPCGPNEDHVRRPLVGAVPTLYGYELAFAGASVVGVAATALVALGRVETYDADARAVVPDSP